MLQLLRSWVMLSAVYLLIERPPLAAGAWHSSLRPLFILGVLGSIVFVAMRWIQSPAAVKSIQVFKARPPLAVHEAGFRFRSDVFPFAEIDEIRLSRTPQESAEQMTGTLGPIESQTRWDAEILSPRSPRPAQAHVTIVTSRGNTMPLGNLLSHVSPEDLEEFASRIEALRPGILRTPSP